MDLGSGGLPNVAGLGDAITGPYGWVRMAFSAAR